MVANATPHSPPTQELDSRYLLDTYKSLKHLRDFNICFNNQHIHKPPTLLYVLGIDTL